MKQYEYNLKLVVNHSIQHWFENQPLNEYLLTSGEGMPSSL